MNKMNEIRKMKDTELVTFVAEKREAARNVRFGTGGRDAHAARRAKKEIARALTELQARRGGDKPTVV